MAGLDDLYAQIPTTEIAAKLGADESEVDHAVHTLVPVLLSGLEQSSQDPEHAGKIESAASSQAARGLLDAGGGLDQVDESEGHQAVATLFGGKDTDQVASALSGGGAGNSDLLKQLLPIVLPIVLAYIGKRLGGEPETKPEPKGPGGLGDVLGSILGSKDKSLGGILGSVLGNKGGPLGDILGGLLGGRK
ncbi:hypothetical protein BST27_12560 [Mycobacterium intermedium]|uniref:DUF937 domain-containing protein n=1 Tax=Mycobacterium intermedium TaxID=28445 RepID=A0A1E3SLZ7_MYCIE|nr:DUF937 domain-containing protein [Mycobacterium intermedium]MCV6964659.1 DUF937 domain-containing protein [Mycobacterium intermedium]ODR03157.1 hypothetical protein BHQ20_01885 [Mycobacterium intermedium]OPE45423.1 hypothetical protein BV508_29740 [Mycobacterium intermedium]ORB05563.1 hypothetical protein BST27_12560 [Mycobacterium intermedium]